MIPLLALAAVAYEPPALAPGDPAPPLEVEWVHGDPIAPATTGRLTLVEFTATWCGPCRELMPEIARLARDHADRVDVVAVHVWDDPEAVRTHVTTHAADLPPHVALSSWDPAQPQAAWMEAAGRNGIPTMFIVQPDGTIAWIGYADAMGRVLDDALAGAIDVPSVRAEYFRTQRHETLSETWVPLLVGPDGRFPSPRELLAALDSAESAEPALRLAVADLRFTTLTRVDRDAAAAFAAEVAANPDGADGSILNDIAWDLVRKGGKVRAAPGVAHALAEESNARVGWRDADRLDTWAWVLWAEGDRAGAIAAEEKALALATDPHDREWIESSLHRFRKQAAR